MSRIRLAVKENTLSDPSFITRQMYLDYLDKLGRGWVCENAGQIVGFSYAAHDDSSIWALFVLPEQEGLGIGKQLLSLATAYLFDLGNDHIKLGTTPDTRADRFYNALSWERGIMKNSKEVAYVLRKAAKHAV
jgi:ribosomal protein S18 acetylase RimI-like enzyme